MDNTKTLYIADKSHSHEWEGITIWSDDLVIAHVVPDQHNNEEANAEFIVRACNAHEGLVKALERIIKASENGPNREIFAEIANEALATAKGA